MGVLDQAWKPTKQQLFDWLGYKTHHTEVDRFHASDARLKIVSAPARTSKSYSAAHDMIWHAFPEFKLQDGKLYPLESKLLWCVGPDYQTDREFTDIFKIMVDDRQKFGFDYQLDRSSNNPKHGNMLIVINWGKSPEGNVCRTIIEGKSKERPKSLQGEEVDACVMSEAAEHEQEIYDKYLSTRCKFLILPTTPKPHAEWIKQLIDKAEEDPSLPIEHFHYWIDYPNRICANPDFNWERFETAMKLAASHTTTGRAEDWPHFAEQFLGMWVYYTGRVLPFRWQPSLDGRMSHVIQTMPKGHDRCKTFVSVDYGYDHPSAALWWKIFPDGTLVLFAEIKEKNLNASQFIDKIMRRNEDLQVDPEYYVGDPSRPEVASLMQQLGLDVYDHGSKNELRDRAAGSMKLIEYMADDETLQRADGQFGRPKLFVLQSGCPQTIYEWKVLRRKEKFKGDEFSKSAFDPECEDDLFDAGRYGIMSRAQPHSKGQDRNWMDEHMSRYRRQQKQRPTVQPALRGMVSPYMENP